MHELHSIMLNERCIRRCNQVVIKRSISEGDCIVFETQTKMQRDEDDER